MTGVHKTSGPDRDKPAPGHRPSRSKPAEKVVLGSGEVAEKEVLLAAAAFWGILKSRKVLMSKFWLFPIIAKRRKIRTKHKTMKSKTANIQLTPEYENRSEIFMRKNVNVILMAIIIVVSANLAHAESISIAQKTNETTAISDTGTGEQQVQVYLSDMHEQRFGNIHGGLGLDKPYWQEDLIIDGIYFKKGIVTHAPESGIAFVEYVIPTGYEYLEATIGLAEQGGCSNRGSVRFFVRGDDRLLFSSGIIRCGTSQKIRIPISGNRVLRLEADNADNGHNSDHASWGAARLNRALTSSERKAIAEATKRKLELDERIVKVKLQITKAVGEFRCDDAKKLNKEFKEQYFSYDSCASERKFNNLMKNRNPEQLYLSASLYESDGERSRAKSVYRHIMDRFPNSKVAIKAADRLTRLTDVEAVEYSNRSAADEVKRSNEKAARQATEASRNAARASENASRDAKSIARQACQNDMNACYARNGSGCYRDCNF